MTTAWRLARIVVAYFLASLASATVVAAVVSYPDGFSARLFTLIPLIAAMIALYASPAALLAILTAELRWIRSVAFYAAVATVIGVALPYLVQARKTDRLLPVTGLCFGPVAGWLYWRIAGRHAGSP